MVTPFQFAAELADAAASVSDRVKKSAGEAAEAITDEWQQGVPGSPGGYEGAGFTSSPGANKTYPVDDGGRVGAEAVNHSFVARFLQRGTAHHGPKYDFLGAADPHAESWIEDVAGEAEL